MNVKNLLLLIIILPWALFVLGAEYIRFKADEINKKEFIKKSIIPTGIISGYVVLKFCLPTRYNNYLEYFFLVVFIFLAYFHGKKVEI